MLTQSSSVTNIKKRGIHSQNISPGLLSITTLILGSYNTSLLQSSSQQL